SSLLSEPSTVKLLARERKPLMANCPAEPTPAPTPGPEPLPMVCGGGATPGSKSANSSNVRVSVIAPSGKVATSTSVNEPLRRPSLAESCARISVSSTLKGGAIGVAVGAAVGVGVGVAIGVGPTGS